MKNVDVKPTVEVILAMSNNMENYAKELRRIANDMNESGDITYAAEALQAIVNCSSNMRMDLLVSRPIREFQKIIKKEEK